jgi:hypothetical protein
MAKPKKPPDENDKKLAQGPGYIPGKDAIPYRPPASARRDVRLDRTAAKPPPLTTIAAPPVFPGYGWIKLYRDVPSSLQGSWKGMSWQARGIFRLLLTECDRDGVLHLGPLGLESLRGLLMANPADWPDIEARLHEMINHGWLLWFPEEPHQACLAWFRESQAAVSPGATRMRKLRQRKPGRE